MDGTGPSGINLDFETMIIYVIDFGWLGTARVRFGFSYNGTLHYCHEFYNTSNYSPYIKHPNKPIHSEIRSLGGAGSLRVICASVMSESGEEKTGILRGISTGTTHLNANAAKTSYLLMAIRLKESQIQIRVDLGSLYILATTNDSFRFFLVHNPSINGALTWNSLIDSGVQYTFGATANTIATAGHIFSKAGLLLNQDLFRQNSRTRSVWAQK